MGSLIEEHRAKLRLTEKEMESYGFDARRGLETYSVQEIKKLARKNGFSAAFLKALGRCLDEHLRFYTALHSEMFEPLLIERDMPEKNIQAIQEWLAHFQRGVPRKKAREPISSVLYWRFLTELEQVQSPDQLERWYEKLRKFYKRDYDIYRFADMLAGLYNEYVRSEILAPDQRVLPNSVKRILRAVAKKKLENSDFLQFLSKRMNSNRRGSAAPRRQGNSKEVTP